MNDEEERTRVPFFRGDDTIYHIPWHEDREIKRKNPTLIRFHVHTMAIVERHIERRIETNGNNRIVVRASSVIYELQRSILLVDILFSRCFHQKSRNAKSMYNYTTQRKDGISD